MTALICEGLSKAYGSREVLQSIHFQVRPGEIVVLLGENGAGKTTLMNILGGIQKPTGGQFHVSSADGQKGGNSPLGFAPQDEAVFPYLTGREQLLLAGNTRGLSNEASLSEAVRFLEKLQLTPAADRLAITYSEGMTRKLMLGMALIGNPVLLLLDETLNGMDPLGVRAARELIQEHARNGGSTLLTTHVLPLAETLATRILFLHKGLLQKDLNEAELNATLQRDGGLEAVYMDWIEAGEGGE